MRAIALGHILKLFEKKDQEPLRVKVCKAFQPAGQSEVSLPCFFYSMCIPLPSSTSCIGKENSGPHFSRVRGATGTGNEVAVAQIASNCVPFLLSKHGYARDNNAYSSRGFLMTYAESPSRLLVLQQNRSYWQQEEPRQEKLRQETRHCTPFRRKKKKLEVKSRLDYENTKLDTTKRDKVTNSQRRLRHRYCIPSEAGLPRAPSPALSFTDDAILFPSG